MHSGHSVIDKLAFGHLHIVKLLTPPSSLISMVGLELLYKKQKNNIQLGRGRHDFWNSYIESLSSWAILAQRLVSLLGKQHPN